jgi:hypothetical protein
LRQCSHVKVIIFAPCSRGRSWHGSIIPRRAPLDQGREEGTGTASGQQSNSANSWTYVSAGGKYSLTNKGVYVTDGGTSLTVVSGNTEVTPTPAPPGAVLALTALPVVAFGHWLRRRT